MKVPIAVGEQFGSKWDVNELIEQQLIDYARVTLPNVGGITEYMKIQALCETHYVGLIPHFTGPVSEAALVHACSVFSGPVLMEMTGEGHSYLPALAGMLRLPQRQDVAQPPSGPGRDLGYQAAATGGGDHRALTADPHVPSARRVDYQLVRFQIVCVTI